MSASVSVENRGNAVNRTTPIRIATRGSKLALWQADWLADRLRQLGAPVELLEVTTSGDVQQSGPVVALGLQGVFTKEIQAAVLEDRADVAVHSLKDLPTELIEGLILAAVPQRESSADALVTLDGSQLSDLPAGARVGTGSLRRQSQLKHLRPDLDVVAIRGNVDTRLQKLAEGVVDAIVLACAGLERLGWADRISERLEPPRMLPAPGQGALGIECRKDDAEVSKLLYQLDDTETRQSVTAERALLALLHAGCSAPVGAWGRVEQGRLSLDALVASLDGSDLLRASGSGAPADAEAIGSEVAGQLLAAGAEQIILTARGQ